jgi:hypothetical protein
MPKWDTPEVTGYPGERKMDVHEIVHEIVRMELKAMNVDEETLSLWDEVAATYEESGPDGVKDLLSDKVKALKKSASKEAREMTDAAGMVSRVRKGRK